MRISYWSSDVCSSDLRLRGLRLRLGLSQSVMAARIGISNRYLSQLEHDDRPMTPSIRQAIVMAFPLNGADFELDDAKRRTSGVSDAVPVPLFPGMDMADAAINSMVWLLIACS